MKWKRIAFILYPFLIGTLLPVLLYLSFASNRPAIAGTIRKAALSTDRPLVVRLAPGRSTAISFTVRPEKVVAGNPQGVEINFVGHDLTLRPLSPRPGNLIVYTKSSRYVILLQMGTDVAYDDAVIVNPYSSHSRPIRLPEDAFTVENIELRSPSTKNNVSLSVLVRGGGRVMESDSFPSTLRCKGCVLDREKKSPQLICMHRIQSLNCRVAGKPTKLIRLSSGG